MALIEVNYQIIRNFAGSIDDYCDLQDQQMSNADSQVQNVLGAEWFGMDTAAFGQKWADVDASDSMAFKLRDSLKNYADALRSCAQAYQSAQEEIYNLSSLLPR